MIAVIFEVELAENKMGHYLQLAADLKPLLQQVDGFISIERFESLASPGKLLSLSFWRDEEAVKNWRNIEQHRAAQRSGRSHVFADYRLRVATVVRDYGLSPREQAPLDSPGHHGGINRIGKGTPQFGVGCARSPFCPGTGDRGFIGQCHTQTRGQDEFNDSHG